MSTQGSEKTGRNLVSEKGRLETEIVSSEYQSSVADLEEDNAL